MKVDRKTWIKIFQFTSQDAIISFRRTFLNESFMLLLLITYSTKSEP
jgi:hypothetical protein